MKDPPISIPWERYLAVDLHKHYLVIGGVNAHQEIVLGPRRMDLAAWPTWAQAHLLPTDSWSSKRPRMPGTSMITPSRSWAACKSQTRARSP